MANAPPLPPRLVNRKAIVPKSQYDREFIATHRPQVGLIPPPLPPRRPVNGDSLIHEQNGSHDIPLLEEDVRPPLPPNGAKTQLLMHTNTNYLLDLCILLGLFDRGYQLMA